MGRPNMALSEAQIIEAIAEQNGFQKAGHPESWKPCPLNWGNYEI